MSKNLIPEIAKMLGVELGEEFKVKGYEEMTFSLIYSGLIIVYDDYPEMEWTSVNTIFDELLVGRLEKAAVDNGKLEDVYGVYVNGCIGATERKLQHVAKIS